MRRWRCWTTCAALPTPPTIPPVLGYALLACGLAYRYVDGVAAYDALRRGLTIAHDSGNRLIESHLAGTLAQLAALHGEPTDAFDYLALAIRHFIDAGSFLTCASRW